MKNRILHMVGDGVKYSFAIITQRFIGLLLVPVYTRIFIPEDYGVMSVIFALMALLSIVMTMGMSGAFFRYYSEYEEPGQINLISTIQLSRVLFCLMVCGLLSIVSPWISLLILGTEEYYPLIMLSMGTIFFNIMTNLPVDIFRMQFKIVKYNILQIGGIVLKTALAIIFVVFMGYGLIGLFTAHLISSCIVGIASFWMIRKWIILKIDRKELKKLLVFGMGSMPGLFSNWVTTGSDRIFLSRFADLAGVGLYSIANQLASIVVLCTSSFRLAWLPTAYRDFKSEEAPALFRQIGLYYVVALNMVVFGLSLFSSDVLSILTPEPYHGAFLYVPILAYGLLFNGLDLMFGEGANFAEKPKYRSFSFLIGAAVNFGLNFYFVPKYGATGASITTLAAYMTSFIIGYYWARKLYPRIIYRLYKTLICCFYFIPLIVIGFWIDSRYDTYKVVIKMIFYIVGNCGAVMFFFNVEFRKVFRCITHFDFSKDNR